MSAADDTGQEPGRFPYQSPAWYEAELDGYREQVAALRGREARLVAAIEHHLTQGCGGTKCSLVVVLASDSPSEGER